MTIDQLIAELVSLRTELGKNVPVCVSSKKSVRVEARNVLYTTPSMPWPQNEDVAVKIVIE
jgi:hypothetical protein